MSEREWGRISDPTVDTSPEVSTPRSASRDPDRRTIALVWLLILFSVVGAVLLIQVSVIDVLQVNRCGQSCSYGEIELAKSLFWWGAFGTVLLTYAVSAWAWWRGWRVVWVPLTGIAVLVALSAVAAARIDIATAIPGG